MIADSATEHDALHDPYRSNSPNPNRSPIPNLLRLLISDDDLFPIQGMDSSAGVSLAHSTKAAAKGSNSPAASLSKESDLRGGGRGRSGYGLEFRVLGRGLGIPGVFSQLNGIEDEEEWNGVRL